MPVHLTWHSTLPVLIATYDGALLNREHREMVKERQHMLDSAAGKVYLLADVRQLENVEDVKALKNQESIFLHRNLHHTLIVLKQSVYRSNLVAIRDMFDLDNVPVSFFYDYEEALAYAARIPADS